MADAYDIIVIGAGAIGLTVAWRAREEGMSVAVLDREHHGAGASGVAAGMLAPVTEAAFGEEALARLNLSSANLFPSMLQDLKETTGEDLLDTGPGTLTVAIDKDRSAWLKRLHDLQVSLGLDAQLLDGDQCRELEPSLHPRIREAVLAQMDRQVDPRRLLDALVKASVGAGVDVMEGIGDARIVSSGSTPCVELTDGTALETSAVVIAAGAWSPSIKGAPEELRHVRPVKGQLLRLRVREPAFSIKHIIRSDEVYIVPRTTGEVVIGATVEEQGFDTAVTAGAVLELLRSADEILPGIRELELVDATAGSRPGTPDNLPMIGATSVAGVFAATGHYRNGILLSPITARLVLDAIAGNSGPAELSPTRFG